MLKAQKIIAVQLYKIVFYFILCYFIINIFFSFTAYRNFNLLIHQTAFIMTDLAFPLQIFRTFE